MVGERKLVSVLFADVADFTGLAEKLDPEDVHEIMDRCFGILGREIHQAGGTINQYTGDGVMALFGAPIACDNPDRPASFAALQVQTRMKEFHRKILEQYGVVFKLRIGIHTGPVVVGAIGDNLRLDYTAVGDTTNLAARLESMAKAGGILVSDRVFQNAKDQSLVTESPLLLKGRCELYGQLTAMFPLKRMFRSYFNLHEKDSDEQIKVKIRGKLKGAEPSVSLDYLFDLFSGAENYLALRDLSEAKKVLEDVWKEVKKSAMPTKERALLN
jgi:class 3 adenylate cyclase